MGCCFVAAGPNRQIQLQSLRRTGQDEQRHSTWSVASVDRRVDEATILSSSAWPINLSRPRAIRNPAASAAYRTCLGINRYIGINNPKRRAVRRCQAMPPQRRAANERTAIGPLFRLGLRPIHRREPIPWPLDWPNASCGFATTTGKRSWPPNVSSVSWLTCPRSQTRRLGHENCAKRRGDAEMGNRIECRPSCCEPIGRHITLGRQ